MKFNRKELEAEIERLNNRIFQVLEEKTCLRNELFRTQEELKAAYKEKNDLQENNKNLLKENIGLLRTMRRTLKGEAFTSITVFANEGTRHEMFGDDSPLCTVGVKYSTCDKEQDGHWINFCKESLTVADVVEAINELLHDIILEVVS